MMTPRCEKMLAIAAFGLLLAAVYADPMLARRNFVGRDLLAYNLPMEKMIHDAYARGRLPVWSAEISGGRPLLPNPNAGALYPVRWLLAAFPFPLAMRLFPILHWFAAGAGLILFLRGNGSSLSAAWLGAATYVFSGVAVSEVFFPHYLAGMALLPWILWATQCGSLTPGRRVVLLALFFAIDLLAAEVFTIGLGIASAVLWTFAEIDPQERWSRLRLLLAALALAALAAAPQIVASLLWVSETRRAVTGMTIGEVMLYSLPPVRLLELVIPYPFGSTWKLEPSAVWCTAMNHGRALGLFSTLYAGALAGIAVPSLLRRRLPGARFAKLLLLIGLVATVPPALIPRSWWGLSSPLPLRNPEKLVISVVFALALLAALAYDLYRSGSAGPRPALAVGLVLSALALLAVAHPAFIGRSAVKLTGEPMARVPAAAAELPAALTEAALLWMLTVLALDVATRPGRPALITAVLLLTIIPVAATRRIPELAREEDAFAPTAFARIQRRQDPGGSYRTLGESIYRPLPVGLKEPGTEWAPSPGRSWTEHTQALWGRGTVFNSDFDSGDLLRMEGLRRISAQAARFRDADAFFGSLALRWGVRFHGEEPLAGYRRVGADALCDWDEHPRAFPDIRLLRSWTEASDVGEAIRALPTLTSGGVALETGRVGLGAARPGAVRLLEKTPERLSLEVTAPDAGWLFVLREYWKWRRVRVDGRRVQPVPAQIAFSAVAIPAGSHRVEWSEEVPGGKISAWGPVLSLGISAIVLRWRRKQGGESPQEISGVTRR